MRKLKLRHLSKATLLLNGEAWIPTPIIIFSHIISVLYGVTLKIDAL